MRYILNSAVITTPGAYTYRLVSIEEARAWLDAAPFVSTVGYRETCEALMRISGHPIPLNRCPIQMHTGDEALVFRLTCRLDNPALKGRLTADFVLRNCEIGILKKEKSHGKNHHPHQ